MALGATAWVPSFYAISIGVLTACFWPMGQPAYAVLGILVMTWGDGLAALVGQNFGRHPYVIFGNKKSIEGSLTMALASFVVSVLVLGAIAGNNLAGAGHCRWSCDRGYPPRNPVFLRPRQPDRPPWAAPSLPTG